ncbi:MAG: YlbF family regulator [Halanaerobiaceae bacterium]
MSVYSTAHKLAREIKNSDQYKEYREIRETILADENKKEMLQDFQQEQLRLQSRQMAGEELSEEDREKFENLRNLVELNQDIKKYLQAESRVSTMLNDLQKILFEDLELGVFEEEGTEG